MSETNYQKGRRLEYRVKKHFEDKGYLVIRSAGSHSPIDLIAISPFEVVFIQVKSSYEAVKRVKREFPLPANCSFFACYPIKRGKKSEIQCQLISMM